MVMICGIYKGSYVKAKGKITQMTYTINVEEISTSINIKTVVLLDVLEMSSSDNFDVCKIVVGTIVNRK